MGSSFSERYHPNIVLGDIHTFVSFEEGASTQHVSSGCAPTPQHISTLAYSAEKGSYTRGLVLDIKGFLRHNIFPHALLYFEEKVHRKKLLRADAIPLLFPRLLYQILEHLGYPSEPQLERRRIFRDIFTLDIWTSMTAYVAHPGAPARPEHPEIPKDEQLQ